MKVLVIVAHADDEAFMCGGSLAKLSRKGHEATVLFATRNEQGRGVSEPLRRRQARAECEARAAAALLDFKPCFLDFQDMRLADSGAGLQLALIDSIREHRPDLVISHAAGDWHCDHRALAAAVPEAVFQAGRGVAGGAPWRVGAVLQGEVDLEGLGALPFHTVSRLEEDDLGAKQAAVGVYAGVPGEHGIENLSSLVEAHARLRGAARGCVYGEAFVFNRQVQADGAALRRIAELVD